MTDRPKASRARQDLLKTEAARKRLLDVLLRAGVMVQGSFVTLGRKCGKPTCRCASGKKHYGKYLSRSEGGRTHLVFVPAADEVGISSKAEQYRRFREARAELMKLASHTASLADDLQVALTEPYGPTGKKRITKRKKDDGSVGES
jgi:hypothetical protein